MVEGKVVSVGQSDPMLSKEHRTILKPTLGGLTLGALSASSGSILVDAGIGAGIGWLIAPSGREKTAYAVGGGVATGLAGVLGLGGLLVYRYLIRK